MKQRTSRFSAKFVCGWISWGEKKTCFLCGLLSRSIHLRLVLPQDLRYLFIGITALYCNYQTLFIQSSLLHRVLFQGVKFLYSITKRAFYRCLFAQQMSYCTEMRRIPFVVTSHMHFHYKITFLNRWCRSRQQERGLVSNSDAESRVECAWEWK